MKTGKYRIILIAILLMQALPAASYAQNNLIGKWRYDYSGGSMSMEITSNKIVIDRIPYSCKIEKNNLLVYEGNTFTAYPFTLNGNKLTMVFPGNMEIVFIRDEKNTSSAGTLSDRVQQANTVKPSESLKTTLRGRWLFQSPEGQQVLEFLSDDQLIFNGETTQYQLKEGIIQAMGDYGWISYPYSFNQGKLLITFPDGTQVPFTKSSQTASGQQASGGSPTWQLQGSFCYWSGSSGTSSSYSSSERISFDGKGNFTFGRESSFSGNAGIAYSGNPNVEKGTYKIGDKFVTLRFLSGESFQVEILMRQNSGRITELRYRDKLYASSLCD